MVLSMKKGSFIGEMVLPVWKWVQKIRVRGAKVFAGLADLILVEGALEGGAQKAVVVAAGQEASKELAKSNELVGAS